MLLPVGTCWAFTRFDYVSFHVFEPIIIGHILFLKPVTQQKPPNFLATRRCGCGFMASRQFPWFRVATSHKVTWHDLAHVQAGLCLARSVQTRADYGGCQPLVTASVVMGESVAVDACCTSYHWMCAVGGGFGPSNQLPVYLQKAAAVAVAAAEVLLSKP